MNRGAFAAGIIAAFLLGIFAATIFLATAGEETYVVARNVINPPTPTIAPTETPEPTPTPHPTHAIENLRPYTPQITIADVEAVDAKRETVVDYIFADGFPETAATVDGDTWYAELPNGFSSTAQLRVPETACFSDTLVIYHAGHNDSRYYQNVEVIERLLAAGHTVLVMDMPLLAQNEQTVDVQLPNVGEVGIRRIGDIHTMMIFMDGLNGISALRYFIEPVVKMVNRAEADGYDQVFIVGFSGGGWTSTLAAAVDERIPGSYSIAGSTPLGMRFDDPRDLGDYEQYIPDFYMNVATYEDLYILSASGGRHHLHVLNEFDTTFDEPRYFIYEEAIQEFLGDEGVFDVFWDEGRVGHVVSNRALRFILEDIAGHIPDSAKLCEG